MKYNFNETIFKENSFIYLENHESPEKGYFKHFGSMLNTNRDIDEDVNYTIAVGWLK